MYMHENEILTQIERRTHSFSCTSSFYFVVVNIIDFIVVFRLRVNNISKKVFFSLNFARILSRFYDMMINN